MSPVYITPVDGYKKCAVALFKCAEAHLLYPSSGVINYSVSNINYPKVTHGLLVMFFFGESHYIFWYSLVTKVLLVTFFCLFEENYTISFDWIRWLKYFLWRFFVCSRRITLYLLIQYGDLSTSCDVFLSVWGKTHKIIWFNKMTYVLPIINFCLFEEIHTILFDSTRWPKSVLPRIFRLFEYSNNWVRIIVFVFVFAEFSNSEYYSNIQIIDPNTTNNLLVYLQ